MSQHLVLAYLSVGEDGSLEFTNSPWLLGEARSVIVMSATSSTDFVMEGVASTLQQLVNITKSCLGKFCETPGVPKTVHSMHCKSMVQRLMTFDNLRTIEGNWLPLRKFTTDPILAFNDLVEVVNVPAIITYAERIAFSPKRLREIMGDEEDLDYSTAGILRTLCKLTARITQP